MTNEGPSQNATYIGPITDTRRWANYQIRADDIFICTPPKCGTTWTQAICAMLIFGTADHGEKPGAISPWVDANFSPIETYLAVIEQQQHRRFLKTHTPFDGIPYDARCSYLVVFRDPRDVFFSGLNHRDNMTDAELAFKAFTSGEHAFEDWLARSPAAGEWDVVSLPSLAHMLASYWPYRHLPNVHMLHYSDMQRDLRGTIARIAAALGITVSDEQLDAFTAAASFDHMKKHAEQFAPESGTGMWKAETRFFATGKSEQWRDKLSPAQLQAFESRLAELLPQDQAEWIMAGSGG